MLTNLIKEFKVKREIYIKIKVNTGRAKTDIKEIMADGALKIDLAAQPVRGHANNELIVFLSKNFNCNKNNIKILSGKTEKTKLIKISSKL